MALMALTLATLSVTTPAGPLIAGVASCPAFGLAERGASFLLPFCRRTIRLVAPYVIWEIADAPAMNECPYWSIKSSSADYTDYTD